MKRRGAGSLRRLIALALPFALGACSLLVETSGLDGESASTAGADASSMDAAGGDAAIEETSGPSSGIACGAPRSCPTDVRFCDTFESALFGSVWGVNARPEGSVAEVSAASACHGAHAAHLQTPAVPSTATGTYRAGIQLFRVFNPYPTEVYARAFLRWRGDPDGSDRLMLIDDAAPSANAVELFVVRGKLQLKTRLDGETPVTRGSTTDMPADAWTCLEWHVELGRPGSVRVWRDDVEVVDLAYSGNTEAVGRPMDGVNFSIHNGAGEPLTDLWVDSVIADTKRIGCAK